jgi:hypothetical protein
MPDNRVRVTKIGAHLVFVDDGVSVTKSGAYAEITGKELRVTSSGAMAEKEHSELRVTSSGAVAEIVYEDPAGPPVVTEFARGAASSRSHYRLPDEVSGYALDPSWSMWSVVVPEETLNYLQNPSFELSAATNMFYSGGVSGTGLSTTAGAIAGIYALTGALDGSSAFIRQKNKSIDPFDPDPDPDAGSYTFSCWVWAQEGTVIRLAIEDNSAIISGTVFGATTFVVDYTGWHRYWVTASIPASSPLFCVLNFPSGASNKLFYTDAWQLEKKLYPTTYCDGDMLGFFDKPTESPYSWSGVAHESSSIRAAWTRSGGRLYNLAEDGQFFTTSITGLNMKPLDLETRTLGSGDEVFVGSDWKARTFTITGKLYGKSYEEVVWNRDRLVKYLQPEHTGNREPLILQYALTDSQGRELTTPVEIICSYTGGLQGSFTNFHAENYALQFRAFSGIRNKVWTISDNIDPYAYRVWLPDGFHINVGNYHGSAGLTDGGWSSFGSTIAPDGFVEDVSWKFTQNKVIMVGDFNTLVDEAALDGILQYDVLNETFDHMSDDLPAGAWNSRPYRVAYGRGNRTDYIMIMGDFTLKGAGVIRRLAIKTETGGTWSEAAIGLSAPVGAADVGRILPLPDGDFLIGGDFLTDMVAAPYNNIGLYNVGTDTLSTLETAGGPGLNGAVHDMVYGRDGYVYLCGAFTAATSGTTLLLVAKYDLLLDVFTALSGGITTALSTAYHIAYGPDGYIYVAHGLTAGGVATTISRWNGTSWTEHYEVGAGGHIGGMAFGREGNLHITGSMSTVLALDESGTQRNYIELSQNVVRNGQLYSETDFNEPEKIFIDEKGRMAVTEGNILSGSAWQNTTTVTITNDGTAEAYPIIIMENRTYRLMRIEFPDVGALINFDRRFIVNADEILRIDFSGEQPRIYSNQRTDLNKFIIPGTTNLRDFRLLPGDNKVRFCISSTNLYDRIFRVVWRNEYQSIDPGVEL